MIQKTLKKKLHIILKSCWVCNMKQVKLKDITTKIGSGATPLGGKTSYKTTGIAFIRSLNIFDLNFSYDELAYITDEQANKLNNVTIEPDDILLNITGASVARCCILPKNLLPARVNQHVSIIRIKKELVNPYFVQYLLVSPYYKQKLLSIAQGGATREALTKESIENFEITIPNSKKSQDKIANILLNYDKLIENNNKRIKILEEMAQKIYKEWFDDFKFPNYENATFKQTELGKIPINWDVSSFEDFISFQEGPGIRNWQYVSKDGINFVNIRCINNNILDTSNTSQISKEEAFGKYKHFLLNENDIIMSTSGTLGKWAIIQKHHLPLCLNTSIIRFTPKLNNNDYSYILGYLKSNTFNNHLTSMATGSAQVNFGPMHLKQIKIIKPNRNILDKYHKIIEPLTTERLLLISKNQDLKQTRDILLPHLISGEIDVEKLEIK